MKFPLAFFKPLIDTLKKLSDQCPCMKGGSIPNDKNTLGQRIFLDQPSQIIHRVFHIRPIVFFKVKVARGQIQGSVKSLAVPLVHHRDAHPFPLFRPHITFSVPMLQMTLILKKNYRFLVFDRFSILLELFFNPSRRSSTFLLSRRGFAFWLLCQLIPASCSRL